MYHGWEAGQAGLAQQWSSVLASLCRTAKWPQGSWTE